MITVNLSPKKTALILACAMLLLIAAHIAGQIIRINLGPDALKGWVRITDMDGEGSIPAWFSSSLLLFCSAMLAVISSAKTKARPVRLSLEDFINRVSFDVCGRSRAAS